MTAPDVTVRTALPAEYEAAGALTVRAYVHGGFAGPEYVPYLADAAGRAAAGLLLVAVDRPTGRLVGTVSLFPPDAGSAWTEHAGPGEAVLRMLAVDPDTRTRGIGAALTGAALDAARDAGAGALVLSSQPGMTAAHRLYLRLGFRRAPERDWEPRAGLRLLGFVHPLG